MTQTTEPGRLTSRQRRIEEQRRKIESARSQQRRTRMLWLGGIVVVVAVAIVAVLLLMPHTTQASQMRQVQTFPGTHYPEGTAIPTTQWLRPPSSGPHWETVPQPQEYRMYDTSAPLLPGRYVHMLEHGAVVVLYRPDLCDSTCVDTLGKFYDNAPRSNLVGIRHLAVTPYQDMDHAVAVVAWGFIDEMDQVDYDRVMADFKAKVDAPTAPERGAM